MTIKELIQDDPHNKYYFTPIQYRILKMLTRHGALTRSELVEKLHTARTTIFDNLIKLQKKKFVEKFSRNSSGKKGRPKVLWKIKN
jgi:predicted ArsR family transcriptional regulator